MIKCGLTLPYLAICPHKKYLSPNFADPHLYIYDYVRIFGFYLLAMRLARDKLLFFYLYKRNVRPVPFRRYRGFRKDQKVPLPRFCYTQKGISFSRGLIKYLFLKFVMKKKVFRLPKRKENTFLRRGEAET